LGDAVQAPTLPIRATVCAGGEAPPAAPLTDAAEIDATYRHWRSRILTFSFVGYAVYYFSRVNISMAIPQMQADLGYSKAQLGLVVSALQVSYGIGKFANGVLADRTNPRYFMALGLLLSGDGACFPCCSCFHSLAERRSSAVHKFVNPKNSTSVGSSVAFTTVHMRKPERMSIRHGSLINCFCAIATRIRLESCRSDSPDAR
jgi:hypothetical protein